MSTARLLLALVLLIASAVRPAAGQDSEQRVRIEAHQREVRQRMEETRERIDRRREESERRHAQSERRRSEEAARREDDARRASTGLAPVRLPAAGTQADLRGAGSLPGAQPLAEPYRSPAKPIAPTQITSMSVEPSMPGDDVAWSAIRAGMVSWALVGVIVGGLVFLAAGMALRRDLTPVESGCAVAIGLAAAVIAPLAKHGVPRSPAGPETARAAPALERFDCAEGGFSIAMPAPRARAQAMAMALPVTQFTFASKDGAYVVGWFDVPAWAAGRDGALDNACTGAVQNMGNASGPARETRRTPIALDGHPGREVEGALPRDVGRFRFRTYLVGNRLYLLTATGFAAWVAGADTRTFLDSFTLTAR